MPDDTGRPPTLLEGVRNALDVQQDTLFDTGPIVLDLWARTVWNHALEGVEAARNHVDLFLLCDTLPDWEPDPPVIAQPGETVRPLEAQYVEAPPRSGRPWVDLAPAIPARRPGRMGSQAIPSTHEHDRDHRTGHPTANAHRSHRRVLSLGYTWGYLQGWTPWCFPPGRFGRGTPGLAVLAAQHPRRSRPPRVLHRLRRLRRLAVRRSAGLDTTQAEPLSWHLTAIAITAGATLATAWALQRWTHSAMPLTDAFTTVFSLWATWLMVQNHHANWAYWIAIDAVAIVLRKRGLPFGAALYAIYLVMAVMGWFGGSEPSASADDEFHRNRVLHAHRLALLATGLEIGQ